MNASSPSPTADPALGGDIADVVDGHLAAYGEPDRTRRVRLIEAVWSSTGLLLDPPLEGEGHAGIDQAAQALQASFPGHVLRRTSDVDSHHDQFRYAWALVAPDGTTALTGVDFGRTTADGRLDAITGFFGDLVARSEAASR